MEAWVCMLRDSSLDTIRLFMRPDSLHLPDGPVGQLKGAEIGRMSETDGRQKARTVCTIGTQPFKPAVYGVKAPL